MSEECRTQKQIAERLGISVFTDFPKKEYTVIIDAVFGVGLSRAIEGRYHTVIEWMNDKKCEKAAIDIPSGICAESGRVLGIAFAFAKTSSGFSQRRLWKNFNDYRE